MVTQGALNLETNDRIVYLEEAGLHVVSSVCNVNEKLLSEAPLDHPLHLTQLLLIVPTQ